MNNLAWIWERFINGTSLAFGNIHIFGFVLMALSFYMTYKMGMSFTSSVVAMVILVPILALMDLLPLWMLYLEIVFVGILVVTSILGVLQG